MAKEKKNRASKIPNRKTISSMKELDQGGGREYTSMEDFWAEMGVKPTNKPKSLSATTRVDFLTG